jgi:putative protein-disulfide isomerase
MTNPSPKAILYYVHDPMCSWCWALAPVLAQLLERLPEGVEVRRVLGGLAPDTDEPMSEELRAMVQSSWRRIQQHLPATELNFAFWTECEPRRATHQACRAVIAAREQGAQQEMVMNTAIQRAYYTQARNPSDEQTLVELAAEIGLDVPAFSAALHSDAVQRQLELEIQQALDMDVESFPTLIFEDRHGRRPIPVDYQAPDSMLAAIERGLAQHAAR